MKKLFLVLGTLILVGLLNANSVVCTKHTIDGNLADWGVNLNNDWSLNSTWLPNAGVSFVVEDNYNPNAGLGYPSGVHIMGVGSSYTFYDEPQVTDKDGNPEWEPYGREYYDIEAFYLDQDANCTYVAVVTSMPPDGAAGTWMAPGDLGMDLDNNLNTGGYGYEYGVKLGSNTGLTQFGLYSNPTWQGTSEIPANAPSYFTDGTFVDKVSGAYVDTGIFDRGYTNYVVELAIPKDEIGNSSVQMGNLHLSEYCGNDRVPAPEFPMLLIPVGIAIAAPLFGYFLASRKGNN